MSAAEDCPRILLIDANLAFARRLSEALRHHGFEVLHCTEVDYALTMVEWSMPVAILCATNPQKADAIEVPRLVKSDPLTRHIALLLIGDGQAQALINAYRAGYDDYIDRRLGAENIAGRVFALLSSRRQSFQPTQMLAGADTALDGQLSLIDLPSVIQMLAQSRQTGALHINAGSIDALVFFVTGEIFHAESGPLVGEDAAAHIVKSCHVLENGVYKFVPGSTVATRTVQKSVEELLLDSLRELDEEQHQSPVNGEQR